ncbi:DNA polymerase I [Cohaesibacter celericrescens]|uniref:DNA polymerase I n=1 Tax=Cohaesibacter celericrescens TaxID=2067669 RepID=A0A2N5XUQ6_9HYPH|nr:DNA polymerase I [Cohaesibacter celericrescens]PLW78187.1 DNA polymerase I [Cohaesibacter celericrescens]
MAEKPHLFLIDGSSYIFRAYHALPPLTRKGDGLPVGAVSGFCNMLWKLLQEKENGLAGVDPSHIAVIFDAKGHTFRNEIFDQYKAHRPPAPEDLRPQFGLIRDAVRAFNIESIELEGYEADDIIATYSEMALDAGADVTIIGSDKDLMQLVRPGVVMVDTMKNKRIEEAEVIEKFGVAPDKVVEVQALAGDSVDNIPGVPGIGIKTAALLINEFGDLESLLAGAETIKQKKRRENLIEFADQARVSKELVYLKRDVPLALGIDALFRNELDGPKLIAFLKAMKFTSMTRRIAEATDTVADAIEPCDLDIVGWEPPQKVAAVEGDSIEGADSAQGAQGPVQLADKIAADIAKLPIDNSSYQTVRTMEELTHWLNEAKRVGYVSVDTETDSLDAMQANLVGVSLATEPGKACYIPLAHVTGEGDMFGGGLAEGQIPITEAVTALKAMLEDPSILKIGQNLKYDTLLLSRYDIDLAPLDDTLLLSYVLDAGKHGHGMDELSELWLDHKPIPFKEIAGTGKKQITFDKVEIDKATAYAAEDADVTLRLWMVLKPRLAADHMVTVYERLERPLLPVLRRMEARGITVDRQILSGLSGTFAQGMARLEEEIHALAEQSFNIGSPKQLGDILFGQQGLPGGKKTKTGAWSTSASVLEDLAAEGHELPARVVEWRQLSKLKSTYTDALPGFINPQTKRVHTSYSLAATTTGRLSSSDPNLQNIPIRTEAGRKIRTAFVATPGNKLISADYSQIELRVLAHMADIGQLKKAFDEGLDIHAMTASEMFNVPIEEMDSATRRRAKAINFGIIYGISAFGLANQLGISRTEAKDYIDMYFTRFPGIRTYMEDTKTAAREQGYVETIFGRKIHYPEINSKNPNMKAFQERAAINAPIQGSAADIIRRAMVRMEGALVEAGSSARMLLQVHDELIFEVAEAEVDNTIKVVRDTMESAPMPALQLSVPLKVDAAAADNWDEAH